MKVSGHGVWSIPYGAEVPQLGRRKSRGVNLDVHHELK